MAAVCQLAQVMLAVCVCAGFAITQSTLLFSNSWRGAHRV